MRSIMSQAAACWTCWGKYGGIHITSIYSHPELPPYEPQESRTITPAMQLWVHAINTGDRAC
jgi:hypothetical protein